MSTEIICQEQPTDGVSRVLFFQCDGPGDLLASSWDSMIRLYNSENGELVTSVQSDGPVLDVCNVGGPNEQKFVAGGLSKAILHGDLSKSGSGTTILGHHDLAIRCIACHPDRQLVLSGSWDKTVKVWDVRTNEEVQQISLPGKVFAMAVSGSADKLVVCDSTKTVSIYDMKNLTEPESVREHVLKYQLRAVDCFSDGVGYAVSSVEGRVAWEFFDPSLGEGGEIIHPVNALAFHSTFGSFATGGGDGGVSVWDGYHKKRLWKLASPFPISVASLSFHSKLTRLAIGLTNDRQDGTNSALWDYKYKYMSPKANAFVVAD